MSMKSRPPLGQQLAHAPQRAGDVEQVIDGLADTTTSNRRSPKSCSSTSPVDRLEAERLRLRHLERRRIDERARRGRTPARSAPATTPVEPPMSSIVASRAPSTNGREQLGAVGGVLALLRLDRARVDQPAVEGADERPVDAVVEAAVGRRRHARIQEHQAAAARRRWPAPG